jgi:hypothetical protein
MITPDTLARYGAGELTGRDVARLCGVSHWAALKALRAAGADTSRTARRRLWSARKRGAVHAKVEALYRQGFSMRDVGILLGLSESAICRILAQRGVATRPTGRPKKNSGKRHIPDSPAQP